MSMAPAIRAMPDCMVTDHKLERLLAKTCDALGVPISFDAAKATGSRALRACGRRVHSCLTKSQIRRRSASRL
jgi:putative aminopeptidase FrvX